MTEKGSDGCRVQTYRTVYENGELISGEKEAYSVYSPHKEIVTVGVKKRSKGKRNRKNNKGKKRNIKKRKA